MELDKDLIPSPTFCVLPWIHVGVRPTGRVRTCTWTLSALRRGDGKFFHLDSDRLSEALSSPHLNEMKRQMLAGETIPTCSRCYEFEKMGNKSKRLTELERFKDKIPEIISQKAIAPEVLELRLGNRCNLACLSCSPDSSSLLYREIEKNGEQEGGFHEQHLKAYRAFRSHGDAWLDSDLFWNDVRGLLPSIKRLYITGGEPTIIRKNWELLGDAIKNGWARNIHLEISTNLMVLTDEQIEMFNQFKSCEVFCSLDASGPAVEYLRYPAKWETIQKNFLRLIGKAKPTVKIEVTPTLNVLSIWHLRGLYQWLDQVQQNVEHVLSLHCHTLLRDPPYQSLINMPSSLKLKAKQEIESLLLDYPDDFNRWNLQKVIRFIDQTSGGANIFTEGQKYIENFDRLRGNSWREISPQLNEVWK